jgi:glutamate carboxypeptidase
MTRPTLLDAARAQRADYLALLERFVLLESPSRDVAAGNRFADVLSGVLRDDGWRVERRAGPDVADIVHAEIGSGDEGAQLILVHYDTVWPIGSLPWRIDAAADRAYGPGAYDMKAGIVNAIVALRLLRSAGRTPAGRVTLLATPDEEVGSHASRALIEETARRHARVYVPEPAREDGAIKVGRKGIADYRLHFHGVPAHAGNRPQDGASALVELAHATLFARGLEDLTAGTTVNPTVARAGHAVNVITEHADLSIDVRVLRAQEGARIDAAMRGYAPRDGRVRVSVEGGLNRPPMEATPGNVAAFEEARSIFAGWGLPLESAIVGGGSDGNFTSALGIATLDGIGAGGGGAHARDEHIRIDDTLARAARLAGRLGGAGA